MESFPYVGENPSIYETLAYFGENCTDEEYQEKHAKKIDDSWYYEGEMIDEKELKEQQITT